MMDVKLRAVEIQRHHPMADWRTVVSNEPLEFRAALTAELKIVCDRTRAARAARAALYGNPAHGRPMTPSPRRALTQSQQDCLWGTP